MFNLEEAQGRQLPGRTACKEVGVGLPSNKQEDKGKWPEAVLGKSGY